MTVTDTADAPIRRVLLVDDDADILTVLGSGLERAGYRVVGVGSAAAAREAMVGGDVDLAIVDMGLPDADGAGLVADLKQAAPAGSFFPVVLITGAEDSEARMRGFRARCDDFLGKPVNLFELQARIQTLLARRDQHAELAVANAGLRQAHERKRLLASMVVHDLRNPLSALLGNVDLMIEETEEEGPEMVREILGDCHELVQKSLSLVAGLLDVEELEEGLLIADPIEADLGAMCRRAARHQGATVKMRSLTISFELEPELKGVLDADLVERVIENLLDNAVRYAPRGSNVVVRAEHEGDTLVLRVGNAGPAVPKSERDRIFGRYYRLEARRSGARSNRGLGLYFCKLVAEAHGGSIAVEELPDLPTCFVVRLPQ